MRDESLEALWSGLQQRYKVTVSFYPGMDLDDLPKGYLTELEGICHLLRRNRLSCSVDNAYWVMSARRELYQAINTPKIRRKIVELARGRAGITGDQVLDLAIILTPFVLFGRGFFSRLGERFADRLFNYLTGEKELPTKDAEIIVESLSELSVDARRGLLKFRVRRKRRKARTPQRRQ